MLPTENRSRETAAERGTPLPGSETAATPSRQNVDWDALVHGIRAGDENAVEILYAAFSRGLRYVMVRILGRQDSEDAMHETLLSVMKAIRAGHLREPDRLPGFVRTIANRQAFEVIGQRIY